MSRSRRVQSTETLSVPRRIVNPAVTVTAVPAENVLSEPCRCFQDHVLNSAQLHTTKTQNQEPSPELQHRRTSQSSTVPGLVMASQRTDGSQDDVEAKCVRLDVWVQASEMLSTDRHHKHTHTCTQTHSSVCENKSWKGSTRTAD